MQCNMLKNYMCSYKNQITRIITAKEMLGITDIVAKEWVKRRVAKHHKESQHLTTQKVRR